MNIDLIKRKILIKYPFFGFVMANSKFIETDNVSTIETDGKDIFYNLKYINTLNKDEQISIFTHQICHIGFNHVQRSKGKNLKIWGIATDAVINALLKKDGLILAKNSIEIDNAENYDAEELYKKILAEMGNSESTFEQEDINKMGHSLWKKALSSKKIDNKLEEYANETANLGEKKVFEKNQIIRKNQFEKLTQSLIEQSKGAGKNSDGTIRKVADIGIATKLIDWRILLRNAIKINMDWSYSNATIEDGIVTPHLEEMVQPETEILLDTSGSVDEKLLRNFLRECKNILQTSKVKIGCFDDSFYGFSEISSEKALDNFKFKGGGGTDFTVAVDSFSKRGENKIIFTDGDANMPRHKCDAIWIVYGDIKISPKGGKVIYITKEQYNKLSENNLNRR